jgi:hypothetical protein
MTNKQFTINHDLVVDGKLRHNPTSPPFAAGSFKTTASARLTLSPLAVEGLGRASNLAVMLKRPYRRKIGKASEENSVMPPPMHLIVRYNYADELVKNVTEANLLYWATALMNLTYAFIDRALWTADTPPPFEFPRLRFVHAGVAIAQVVSPKASATHRSYLLEEAIEGEFEKYIHNGAAVPLQDMWEPTHERAVFLCCAQHIQYIKTNAAFISDYQGVSWEAHCNQFY